MPANIVKLKLQNTIDYVTIEVTSNINAAGSCLMFLEAPSKPLEFANIKLKDDIYPDLALVPVKPSSLKNKAVFIHGSYVPIDPNLIGISVTYTVRQGSYVLPAVQGTNPILNENTAPMAPIDVILFV